MGRAMNGHANGTQSTSSVSSDVTTRKPENIGVFTNPEHDLYTKTSPIPTPGAGECLVHVRATGICGSDVHFWKKGRIGDMVVTCENCLGHESAGEVIAVGEGVKRFKPGDRVALECGIPCMKPLCDFCRTGRYNACPDVVFFSTPPYHGTLTRYHLHPEDWLHSIPEEMTFEEGSLLEPLSVALAGIDRSGLRLGQPIVICGAGPIGLVTLLAANASGANPIVITDLDEGRLATAKTFVPRVRTVKINTSDKPTTVATRILENLGGVQASICFECTGVESSLQSAIYSTAFGGTVFVIGCGKDFQSIPFAFMSAREIDLRFQYRYKNTYPKAIGLVSAGIIDLSSLVTHRFSLEDGVMAFQTASDPSAKAIKVQILDD